MFYLTVPNTLGVFQWALLLKMRNFGVPPSFLPFFGLNEFCFVLPWSRKVLSLFLSYLKILTCKFYLAKSKFNEQPCPLPNNTKTLKCFHSDFPSWLTCYFYHPDFSSVCLFLTPQIRHHHHHSVKIFSHSPFSLLIIPTCIQSFQDQTLVPVILDWLTVSWYTGS